MATNLTLNILAFFIYVFLSPKKKKIKMFSQGPLVELSQNDPIVKVTQGDKW